ncbi:OLC1v1032261C1 [Oldenlandia corymbosa var. corymbosa]|uniref:OLC1v1032261C1 n=1 Tax=Oldenlandia corymbosa var. corymbosa TaxID=529605 RepID=A0AAV1CKN9_OLDCO|nr:OLC1v1032261C1 [Oldenlandia corymbosa var. corymbosa]
MGGSSVTVMCYWNGKVTNNSRGISYEGQPGVNCLEFYLEAIPVSTEAQADAPSRNGNDHPTQLPGEELGSLNWDYESASGICVIEDQGSHEARREDLLVTGVANSEELEHLWHQDADISQGDPPASKYAGVGEANEVVAAECEIGRETDAPCYPGDLYVGQRFPTKEDLQNAVKAYSVRVNQEYVVAYSTENLWVLKCKQAPECPWRLRATTPKEGSFFEIKKYTAPHVCKKSNNQGHAQMDSAFVARHIKALVKAQNSISSSSIQAEILEKFNYSISTKKAWTAKQKAIIELFGDRVKRSKRGRPKSGFRAMSESIRCSSCKKSGHNKRKCPRAKDIEVPCCHL